MPLKVSVDAGSTQSSGVGKLRTISPQEFVTHPPKEASSDFAGAFYGDGPYSLEHPNNRTEFVAQNVDYLA